MSAPDDMRTYQRLLTFPFWRTHHLRDVTSNSALLMDLPFCPTYLSCLVLSVLFSSLKYVSVSFACPIVLNTSQFNLTGYVAVRQMYLLFF
jgi:hypothetical protein